MKNNTAFYILACIIAAILLVALAYDEHELARCKANENALQEKIAQLENDKSELATALDTANARIDELESEQEAEYDTQAYIYYGDSAYSDLNAKDYIAQRESGGDYDARNGRYYGKYQLDESMLNGDYSPDNQEETAERYVMERYGSWENARDFWDAHGWY